MRGRGVVLILAFVAMLPVAAVSADFSASAMTGYKGGLGFKVAGTLSRFAQGFPLGLEFGVAHTRLDPGKPAEARKVFINDATNGTPEESGWIWDMRLDFLIPIRVLGLQNAAAYLGVRRSLFTANFNFVGGNEDFDVTSNQWGYGAGVTATFPMGKQIGFTVAAGLDHFPNATIHGHDTSYAPDGESVNGRQNYDYTSADDSVNQPKLQALLMAGITVTF